MPARTTKKYGIHGIGVVHRACSNTTARIQLTCTEHSKSVHLIRIKAAVSLLPDAISTTFQRVHLCCMGVQQSIETCVNITIIYSTSYNREKTFSTCSNIYVFDVEHFNGTCQHTVRPNRKTILQDGGLYTSNAYISACFLDFHFGRIQYIPTSRSR